MAACSTPTADEELAAATSALSEDGYIDAEGMQVKTITGVEPARENQTVIDDWEHLHAEHGTVCSSAQDPNGVEDFVEFAAQESLPSWATDATVFMNGWRAEYLNGDHHVGAIQAQIQDVQVRPQQNEISWRVRGHFVDDNGDDPYRLCVVFTVIAWSSRFVNARVTSAIESQVFWHSRLSNDEDDDPNRKPRTHPSARHTINSSLLPTGFRYQWQKDNEDHHLHSVLYDMATHRFGYRQQDDFAEAWYQDNGARPYRFTEWTNLLAGTDAHFYLPDPAGLLLPIPPTGGNCVTTGTRRIKTQQVVIPDVPHRYAVPILSGWDLRYACHDAHVERIGTWIDTIRYVYNPGSGTGSLSFNMHSLMHDNDGWPGHLPRFRVSVLGFNATPVQSFVSIRATGNRTSMGYIRLFCGSSFDSCQLSGNFDHMETGCTIICPNSEVTAQCGTNGQRNREIDGFAYWNPNGRNDLSHGRTEASDNFATGADPIDVRCDFTD